VLTWLHYGTTWSGQQDLNLSRWHGFQLFKHSPIEGRQTGLGTGIFPGHNRELYN
jgi:hypothetical protein